MFELGAAGSDEQLKIPGDTVLIKQVKNLSQQLMLTSPTPIRFCTSFNLRRLRSRLTKGRVTGIRKWIRSWRVLLVPLLHPPLLQGPLLVPAQQGLRWLPAPPLQVLHRFPFETGHGAGPQSSTTISDALAVTSANLSRILQPRCCHPVISPRYHPVRRKNQKQSFSLPRSQRWPFQLLGNFLQKESRAIWIREVWAIQRNSEQLLVGSWLVTATV